MKKIKLKKWDLVDYLKTEDEIFHYINACLEENDLELIIGALSKVGRINNRKFAIAIANALASIHIEGLSISKQHKDNLNLYAEGKKTIEEIIEDTKQRYANLSSRKKK